MRPVQIVPICNYDAYIIVNNTLTGKAVAYFLKYTDKKIICIERVLDTTTKFNLKHALNKKYVAF